jgi:hypothetical protein
MGVVKMKILFSQSTKGFYHGETFPADKLPEDVVEITPEKHEELLNGQTQGKMISSDKKGNPILVDFPSPDLDKTLFLINKAIQSCIDDFAKSWGYDDLVSAASYLSSTNKQYAEEAAVLIAWRDSVWDWAIPNFSKVKAGDSAASFIAKIPTNPEKPKA